MIALFDAGAWERWPFLVLACVLSPMLLGLALWTGRRHQRRLAAVFKGRMLERILPRAVRTRRAWRDALALLGVGALFLALAGPRVGPVVSYVKQSGVDMVLVIDLSRSMDATDVDPTRIERVRREIEDLIGVLEGDRVGVVTYAGGAFPRLPLTADHQALRMVTSEIGTRDFIAQGSELGEAIREAMKLLTSHDDSATGQAIVVFSDGEVHDAGDATVAAREAGELGIRVFGVGVGEEMAPIPQPDGTFVVDENGRTVMSTPSPELLKELARLTGGAYVDSVPAKDDMETLYREEMRGLTPGGEMRVKERETWVSVHQAPLAIGIGLSILAGLLGDGRRRWGAALAALVAVGTALSTQAEASDIVSADQLYRDGRYAEAAEELTQLTMEQPGDADLYERLGAARYRAGDFEGAARAWETQQRLRGGEDADAAYNAGNAHLRSGRYDRAVEQFERALEADAEHRGAARNLEAARKVKEMHRSLQRPPPQEQPPGGSGDPSEDEQNDGSTQNSSSEDQQQGGSSGDPKDEEPNEPKDPDESGSEESTSGSSDGERDPSNREGEGDVEPGESQGQKNPGEDQDAGDNGESESGGLDEPGDGEPGEAGSGAVDESGAFTEEQADKYLDGVEEGRPHFRIPGKKTSKPW